MSLPLAAPVPRFWWLEPARNPAPSKLFLDSLLAIVTHTAQAPHTAPGPAAVWLKAVLAPPEGHAGNAAHNLELHSVRFCPTSLAATMRTHAPPRAKVDLWDGRLPGVSAEQAIRRFAEVFGDNVQFTVWRGGILKFANFETNPHTDTLTHPSPKHR